MKNDSTFNPALAGIYRAAVAVSALIILLSVSSVHAADPPVPRGNVSATLNPTTGYYSSTNSTVRLPDGVRVSPDTRVAPVVSKYPAGLQQTIPMGITIDAIKKSAPLPAVVRSTTQSVKGAATRCLTSGRCNVGLILAGEGLSRLFDGLDWVMGEGGKIQKKGEPPSDIDTSKLHYAVVDYYDNKMGIGYTPKQACFNMLGRIRNGYTISSIGSYSDTSCSYWTVIGHGFTDSIRKYGSVCPEGSVFNGVNCDFEGSPVTSSEIADAVGQSYDPEPSDWVALTPELELDDVEITSAPTLQGEPKTTTVYDADGNPHKVTETNIWYDFDIRDNPSPRPALDLKVREETKTYEDGVLTGTTTTTSGSSAGSNDTPPPPESPIDCDLFPTACAWFDWTQEEPVEPDTDLSGLLQEVPIVSETYTIMGGVAACPAPMVLDLSVFGSREVSYQPLCDLASTMKYLYLALMSFAAAVLLNRSVNRV